MSPLDALTAGDELALSTAARHVLLVLVARAGNDTGQAFPGIARLTVDTRRNRHTVIAAVAELEAAELVTVTRRDGRPNRYQLAGSYPQPVPRQAHPSVQSGVPRQALPSAYLGTGPVPRQAHELRTNYELNLGEPRPPEPPPYVRCPNRTGWKICEPDCTVCHGTGHVPREAVS